jgi:hypothetical protein
MSTMPDLPEVPEEPTKEPTTDAATEAVAEATTGAVTGAVTDAVETSTDAAPRATDDELFAQLIAGFDDPVEAADRSWPAAEDVTDLAPQPRPRPVDPLVRLPRIQAIPPVDPRAYTPEEDPDEEHFVPPPPPPLPRAEAPTRLAIAALISGAILFLLSAFGYVPALGGMGELLGISFFIGGIGTLFARMRVDDEDDPDDDPHRGAVV